MFFISAKTTTTTELTVVFSSYFSFLARNSLGAI